MNDQPGRVLAVTVIGPLMLWAGVSLTSAAADPDDDSKKLRKLARCVGPPMTYFAIFFIVYELVWVLFAAPRSM